ncbi:peptidyl-prolyl cis-trans isomerase FKBP8-like [Corticium candelabrum]|uniref:peptidyl-prolyl cis-trans isomerase FKBP8-like n=1 Tax=Corticium candelabrum TaxID=121492 RepID=UPI002E26BCED|nr:peptidyl-prolyl cis-trans isomerase FKBP8-like [Corticium candelabrum]
MADGEENETAGVEDHAISDMQDDMVDNNKKIFPEVRNSEDEKDETTSSKEEEKIVSCNGATKVNEKSSGENERKEEKTVEDNAKLSHVSQDDNPVRLDDQNEEKDENEMKDESVTCHNQHGSKTSEDVNVDENLRGKDDGEETMNGDVAEREDNGEFVEDKDGWLDILGGGVLKKKVLQKGKGEDTKPKPPQIVTINLEERLEDGTVVIEKREISFTVSEGEALPAVDMTVCLMCLDEVVLVESDARFAYAEPGLPPHIPPNARMQFKIELTKVEPAETAFDQPMESFVAKLEQRRVEGNNLFKQGNYQRAVIVYKKVISRLESVNLTKGYSEDKEAEIVRPLKISSLNNFAAACLHVEMYKEAIESCDQVLAIDQDNSKAHFRKAKALASVGQLEESIESFQRAQRLEPKDSLIHRQLRAAQQELSRQNREQRAMYAKMIDGLSQNDSKDVKESKQDDDMTSQNSWFSWGKMLLVLGAVGALIGIWWVRSS